MALEHKERMTPHVIPPAPRGRKRGFVPATAGTRRWPSWRMRAGHPGREGPSRAHPALGIAKDAELVLLRAWRQLGLDVAAPGKPGRPQGS